MKGRKLQLAIDTSTDTASLALVQNSIILAELTWRSVQNHTTQLTPNLSYLMHQAGLSVQSIDGIIVAKGPGSYNGLRVGVSTAKGLAFSLGVPIVGISTMAAEAYQHAGTGLPVCPVFNAGRGEIATALYQHKENKWCQLVAEHITTLDSLCSGITGKTIFCGEYVPVIADRLREQLQQKAVLISPIAGLRRAGFLAELGMERLKAGDSDDPVTLQPLYLRGAAITQAKHR
ncbi:MAG: tRNA (adenosine(37)-N6)-threonylcarbamoyltransferase complex dimerization subunit type 1 TsaB [Chloroflexi bacterium]|nr:tRNA (adenosine(37)-N6)-threonylcarbamoyltransferase complex dimerization subunit type 1 TsaB [Chloroflexota bacterium]